MTMRPCGRLQLLLVAILIAIAAPKGALSAGRSLLTAGQCNTCTDYYIYIDGTTLDFAYLTNAAVQVISQVGADCSRYYVATCDSRGVVPRTSSCSGDHALAITSCFNGGLGGGRCAWHRSINDAVETSKKTSPCSNNKEIHVFANNDNIESSSHDLQSAVQYAKDNKFAIKVWDLGNLNQGPKPWCSSVVTDPDNLITIRTDPSKWRTSCSSHVPKPALCGLQCQDLTLTLTASRSTGTCTARPCPGKTAGNTCYQVYKSGLLPGATLSTPDPANITLQAGTSWFSTLVTINPSNDQPACAGTVTINCLQPTECSVDSDCNGVLKAPDSAVCTAVGCRSNKCVLIPAPQGTTCDDGNLCTGSPPGPDGVDMCDGRNMGFAGCNNPGSKPNTCDGESPPGLGSYCYGSKGTCNKADGICYFPLLPAALRQAISANSYCGTWGGGFAAQLVNNGSTPSGQGSTVFSSCKTACSVGTCASNIIPQCSCNTLATSYSFVQVGTRPPCPTALQAQLNGVACSGGVATLGTSDNATCWYPDPDPKKGEGGVLSKCYGNLFTEYSLTGGTAISQCMGCVTFGDAYSINSTTCYAGNITDPADPGNPSSGK